MEEIWKDVKGFESLYMVSNLGRVKNVPHYVTRKYYRPCCNHNNCYARDFKWSFNSPSL